MTARVIDGNRIAAARRAEIAQEVAEFIEETGITPHLAVILVGDDPASRVYVRNKRKACEAAGLKGTVIELPAATSMERLLEEISRLSDDAGVHGILVQFPLPVPLSEQRVIDAMNPAKDVDAFHPWNVGLLAEGRPRFLPCTPAGVIDLLAYEKIPLPGSHVVIVGRSQLVGRPLSMMLSQKGARADATVTLCHSKTRNLGDWTRRADVLVAAIGKPRFITADMVKPNAIVIDVGINRLPDGALVGDVAYEEVANVAGAITPAPGGVGPMTVTTLLANTLKAARLLTLDSH